MINLEVKNSNLISKVLRNNKQHQLRTYLQTLALLNRTMGHRPGGKIWSLSDIRENPQLFSEGSLPTYGLKRKINLLTVCPNQIFIASATTAEFMRWTYPKIKICTLTCNGLDSACNFQYRSMIWILHILTKVSRKLRKFSNSCKYIEVSVKLWIIKCYVV